MTLRRAIQVVGAIVQFFIASTVAVAQTTTPAQVPSLPYAAHARTMGAATCASSLCHGSVQIWPGSNVLQNEYVTWSRVDKHATAYNLLKNAESQRIAKNLNLPQPAHEAPVCLDCHAHHVPQTRQGEQFRISEGITCESCHGPAEKWIRSHVAADATHAANVSNGLYATEDPVQRAKLCLSCHFGNADKVVTHRIMGAGHPRLRFELETFSEAAPKHYEIDDDYRRRKRVTEGARVWAIGQALMVAETLDWLNDPKRNRDGIFPELVLFDCHACHRPMRERRLQPTTPLGASATPGLVRLNDGNLLMLRAIATTLEPALGEELRKSGVAVHAAIATRNGADVATASNALKASVDKVVSRLKDAKVDAARLAQVAGVLIDDSTRGRYRDVAAAEQAAMAVHSIGRWLAKQGNLSGARAATFETQWKALNATLADEDKFKPDVFTARLTAMRPLLLGRSD